MLPSRLFFDNMLDDFSVNDKIKCDIYEKNGNYYVEADIPGFKKEEISVECEDGYITITAEKNTDTEEKDENKKYLKRERFYGKTTRKFYVGDIDSNLIKAEFKDGILNVTVPKDEKQPNKKSINIL